MAHDAYSGGGEEDLGDHGSLRPFGNEFNSFDPRLESARFDSSRMESSRFDSSFRASEDFNADHFHDDEGSKDAFDDFKGASNNGFEHHPPPIYEDSYDDEQATGNPAMYSQSLGSESPSDFAQRSEYSVPDYSPPVHLNGGATFNTKELDEDFFAQGSPIDDANGAVLPPPEEMEPEEGHILREWKRQNALHLEEKERIERERLQQIIDDADDYKDELIAKRKMNREANIKKNRDQEKVYLANQENFHKNADKAYWKAVAELLPKELPPSLEPKGRKDKKEKKSTFVANKGPKPGKPTDLGRMRQVLLKLKHNPPAHMIPPPSPPPKPAAEATKEAAKGENPAAEAAGVPPIANEPAAAPEATPQSTPATA
jgi:hypothetical protein